MYSFLNDNELYGSTLLEQANHPTTAPIMHAMQPGAPVAVQTQQIPRERPTEARPVPAPPSNPQPISEFFLKSFAILEQRLLSLEERVVVALEKISSADAACKQRTETSGMSFWTFLLAVALSTGIVLLILKVTRQTSASQATPMPFVLQSMPPLQSMPAQVQPGLSLSGPPTPIIFSAPTSFLPRF